MRFPVLPVLLFVCLRLCLLGTNFEATCVPNYELAPMGLMAWAQSHGVAGLGPAELYDNCGGHLVVGWLGAWLYGLLGNHYAALKLVPLGFGAATMVLLWWSLRRHVGPRVAGLFPWLFALGTPALFQASVIAMGNHYEGLFAQACVYAAYLEVRARPSALRALVFGLVASLATTMYFGASVMVFACAVTLAWSLRAALGRVLPGLLVGAAAGMLPLFWIEHITGGRPSGFLSHVWKGSGGLDLGPVADRTWRFLSETLVSASSSPGLGPVPGRWLDLLFLVVVAVASVGAAFLAWRGKDRSSLIPILLFLPGVVFAFSFSNLGFPRFADPVELVGRRYTYGLQLAGLVLIAWCSGRWIERGWTPLAVLVLVATVPVLASGLGRIRPGSWALEPIQRYAGHHDPYLVGPLLRGALDQPDLVRQRLDAMPAEAREGALFGVGHHLGLLHLTDVGLDDLVAALSRVLSAWNDEERPTIARGLGASLRSWVPLEEPIPERFRQVIALLHVHPGPLRNNLVQGMAEDFEYPLVRNLAAYLKRTHRIAHQLPEGMVDSLWEGHGRRCRRMAERGLPEDHALLRLERERVPARHEAAFQRGALEEGQP